MKGRMEQIIPIVSFLGFCWLAMQAVHEFGHVAATVVSGGTVEQVVLHPLTISRTDVGTNPHPVLEIWAGAVAGVALPLLVLVMAWAVHSPGLYLFRFFAGFCCVANGTYIAFGPSDTGMDTEIMLLLGASRWQLLLFGVPAIALGLYLWHGLGPHFGLGEAKGRVSRSAVLVSLALLSMTVIVELALWKAGILAGS
ncbi:MAG: hypothetical protein IT365_28165 [Candidatus Hydrogenedentes bacterium]|nr:hypothetical protein [Candidatus Hydrogenedentota bacterium]